MYDTSGVGLADGLEDEMLTPPVKNGALIGALLGENVPPQISEDGSRVIAPSIQCFERAQSCIVISHQGPGGPDGVCARRCCRSCARLRSWLARWRSRR